MISIVIPTYEMCGKGPNFLETSLKQLEHQSFKDFEVIISDHSKDDTIIEIVKKFENNLHIRYFSYKENFGNSSANLNNGLSKTEGDIIKILFQDEYIINDGLSKINNFFLLHNETKWLLNSCLFGESLSKVRGELKPSYNENIIKGINTIGSPSVLSVRKENLEFFNEKLIWLMDCEYYFRLFTKFGKPSILDEKITFITQHSHQLTNLLNNEHKSKEQNYILKQYLNE